MTRSELIEQLTLKHPQLTPTDVKLAVGHILEGIALALENQGRVEIRGFGSFVINHRPPRTGRNPKTGVAVMVPAKATPHFRAGKELRERINNG
jgi:integration host factor subunit beta